MRTIRTGSLLAAALASVVAPIVAVSYLHTPDGVEYLTQGTVAAWAGPVSGLLQPLLTGLGAERLYLLSTQTLALLWTVTVVAAVAVARHRRPVRAERVWWIVALIGYAWFTAGLLSFSMVAQVLSAAHPAADLVFLTLVAPGLLVGLIGSTGLGVTLLRRRYPARSAAWLLASAVPLWLIANLVLGHNSLGLLPVIWAWALAARQVNSREPTRSVAPPEPAR